MKRISYSNILNIGIPWISFSGGTPPHKKALPPIWGVKEGQPLRKSLPLL
jgi:hypothetical protein